MIVLVALAYALGIALGEGLGLTAATPGGALAVGAVLAGGLGLLLGLGRRWPGLGTLGLALALGAAGQAARPRAPPELTDGGRWLVEGRVAAPPERAFGQVRLPIALDSVERAGRARAAAGRVALTVQGELAEPLLPGDRVRLPAVLRAPRGLRDPGLPDQARRAAAAGVMAVAGVHEPPGLSRMLDPPAGPPGRLVRRAVEAARLRLLEALRRALPPGPDGALLASLVLGDRGDIERPLDDAFRSAGVSHVLSVSGLHLAIAALLFYAGLTRLFLWLGLGRGRPVRRFAALAALPATVGYTLLTGAQVATVRACVVALVWLGGVALGRRASAVQALAIAALALLSVSPLELYDPSFQLSFAAALGTTLLGARWAPSASAFGEPSGARRSASAEAAPRRRPGSIDQPSLARRSARWALRLLVASLAALLATAPIAAWHFSQLSPIGPLTNLVVVPLAELVVVPVGLLGCLCAWLGLGHGPLLVAGFAAWVLARFVTACAAFFPAWTIPAPTLLELALYYAGLGALALPDGAPARPGRRRAFAAVAFALCALSFAGRALAPRFSDSLTATFLDVGQGDACVLELPGGHVVVIDGGGSFDPTFDPGEQVLQPFLRRRGIRHIDLVVLSHPHPDHANGLGWLVENLPVDEVWTNGQESAQPGTLRLLQAARRRGVPVGRPRPLALGSARLAILRGQAGPDPALGENDNSIVLVVEHAGRRLLFPGDAEQAAEAELTAAARAHPEASLAADVLKVPHHGSRTSSTAPFLAAVHPQLAVISDGVDNRWGFPHADVLERLRSAGARVLRTDELGAIEVRISSSGRIEAGSAWR